MPDPLWTPLVLKMLAAMSVVIAAALTAERAGPFLGALIVCLAVSAGPAYVLLAALLTMPARERRGRFLLRRVSMASRVAVIGLGTMGYGAAASLLRRGFAVTGCDLRDDVRARFAAAGGKAVASPLEAARDAEAVFVFVVDAAQTAEALFGANGAASALASGALVACCATVSPAAAEELGARLESAGLLMLDAPVSGGGAKASSGEMTVMASGSAAAFAKAAPFLAAIATKVYRLGERPGQGSKVKMINQLLAGVHIAAACEAMAFGMRNGIDPAVLFEVISNSAGASWMFQNRVPHILDGDYAPRSAVDIFVKDLGIVLETGKAVSFPLPVAAAAHQLFLAAAAKGLGREDDSAVVKVYADQAGLTLPRKPG